MTDKYSTLYRWINVITDYILLNGTLYASFIITHDTLQWTSVYDQRLTILLLNFCWFYSSSIFKIYENILGRDAVPFMNANFAAMCLYIILALIIKFILPHLYVPPTPFIYYFSLFPIFILIWKFSFLLIRRYKRRVWAAPTKVVILGTGKVSIDLCNHIMANPQLNFKIVGVFGDNRSSIPPYITYLGKSDDCIKYAKDNQVDEVYCTLPNLEGEKIEALMEEADKHMLRFRLVPDLKGKLHHNFLVEFFGYVPVMKPRQEPLENKANEIIKRFFDIVFSAFVIVFILSWLIPIMAIIIKAESKGPVFFKQLRSGKNNKPFYCLKFRSMAVNTLSDSLQASKDDMRITTVGKFIRKTSIDELPQFINVFMGDMSVVGPRPHMLKHTTDYSSLINNYMVRHFLTPGITGWAQVNGYRGETKDTGAMLNRVKADLWYLENWSVLLDFKIVFKTFFKVIFDYKKVY